MNGFVHAFKNTIDIYLFTLLLTRQSLLISILDPSMDD